MIPKSLPRKAPSQKDPSRKDPSRKTWDRPIAGSAIDVSLIAAPLTSAVMRRHRVSAFGGPDDRLRCGIRYSGTSIPQRSWESRLGRLLDRPACPQVATANFGSARATPARRQAVLTNSAPCPRMRLRIGFQRHASLPCVGPASLKHICDQPRRPEPHICLQPGKG
jgi:hypothetical protein